MQQSSTGARDTPAAYLRAPASAQLPVTIRDYTRYRYTIKWRNDAINVIICKLTSLSLIGVQADAKSLFISVIKIGWNPWFYVFVFVFPGASCPLYSWDCPVEWTIVEHSCNR